MKRVLLGMTIVGGAALLAGCPVYPDNGPQYYSSPECQSAYDCPGGYACDSSGECEPYYTPPSEDASTGEGPCGTCPTGTLCTLVNGSFACLFQGGGGSFDSGTVTVDSGVAVTADSGPATVDGGASDGGGDGATTARACNMNAQCSGSAGAVCIDGLCTAQAQLCSDGSQCFAAGSACVNGVCLPGCDSTTECPAGYACDFNRGVCSVNPAACTASNDCQGGAVCVETRCVAPCPGDGGALPAGTVCVNGGIIPDEQARFTCQNDGASGSLASSCDPDSICLHGDCYPACDGEGGSCAAGQSCTSVTITKGTFAVCAAAASLGSQCDPAVGSGCTGDELCINGFCK
ncbi:MAG TPA: hypothetical protein VHV30_02425 [Polyangiaceae bacterium]|nr:hypothetical protein [Polyangiaceae bacterium]